jgi:hypothetical protein
MTSEQLEKTEIAAQLLHQLRGLIDKAGTKNANVLDFLAVKMGLFGVNFANRCDSPLHQLFWARLAGEQEPFRILDHRWFFFESDGIRLPIPGPVTEIEDAWDGNYLCDVLSVHTLKNVGLW